MVNKIETIIDGIPLRGIKTQRRISQTQIGILGVIDHIDRLPEGAYLAIDQYQALLPLNKDGFELTPTRFKKRFRSLSIRAPKTKRAAIETHADPQVLAREAVERKNLTSPYGENDNVSCRGYGWSGVSTDRRHRIIPLTECLRGLLYLANFDVDLLDYAKSCVGEMASKTNPKRTTTTRIDSLPVDPEQHSAQWINLAKESTTEREVYDSLHQGYTTAEVYWNFHDVATLLKRGSTASTRNQGSIEKLLSNPVLLPNKSLLRFFNKLNNQVIKQYFAQEDMKETVKPRKLNLAEKENLLWWKVYQQQSFSRSFVEDSSFSYLPEAKSLAKL